MQTQGQKQIPKPKAVRLRLADGSKGTHQTLKVMVALVKEGKRNPSIRQFTAHLVSDLPQKDFRAEIDRIFSFVQDQIRYVKDIRGVETLHPADQILAQGYGDCDDKCILLASMLETISHPTRFVAAGFDANNRSQFSHVFVDTRIGLQNNWISLDATMPHGMGWRPPNIAYSMILNN